MRGTMMGEDGRDGRGWKRMEEDGRDGRGWKRMVLT
jgi:hypothetical protein